MIRSMTGFGRGVASVDGVTITVELSAVNHRFCEVVVKAPSALGQAERPLRRAVQDRIERGRVTASVQLDVDAEESDVRFNEELARTYIDRLRQFGREAGLTDDLSLTGLLRIGHLWDVRKTELPGDESLTAATMDAAAKALNALLDMRNAEGEALASDLLQRLTDLEKSLAGVEVRAPLVPEEYREKLTARVEQLRSGVEIDGERIAQEVVMFAERGDITEEIVRYKSHVVQCRDLIGGDEPAGRRLDFLCQELNRETNTIASKSRDETIGALVVDMKAQLEKVREQVQNVE